MLDSFMKPAGHARWDPAAARALIEMPVPTGPAPDWASSVTVIIKTFERPCCVAELIRSIRAHQPWLAILVCDDSRTPLYDDGAAPVSNVTWRTLPFEDGHTLGAGRNFLIDSAQTPYVFLCDDDHSFTAQTRIAAMHDFLEYSGFDIVGGAQGSRDYGAAIFERDGTRLLQRFHRHHGLVGDHVVACDRVSNTFLARTAALRAIRWEEQVYAHEHADFFIRASREGCKIAQMGRTYVGHDRRCERPQGLLGTMFGAVMAHRNAHYNLLRMGGGPAFTDAKRLAKDRYRRHVLDKNGVSAIADMYSWRAHRDLYRLIGRPTDPAP